MDNPANAPEGVEIHEGEHGGFYYFSEDAEETGEGDEGSEDRVSNIPEDIATTDEEFEQRMGQVGEQLDVGILDVNSAINERASEIIDEREMGDQIQGEGSSNMAVREQALREIEAEAAEGEFDSGDARGEIDFLDNLPFTNVEEMEDEFVPQVAEATGQDHMDIVRELNDLSAEVAGGPEQRNINAYLEAAERLAQELV